MEWPAIPYKGLSYYTPEDVALFGGRTADIRQCARVLVKDNTKALILHGNTGCGKSSFLRAGLIPFLESEIGRFEFLSTFEIDNTKSLFVRCTNQPLSRLCETLFDQGNKTWKVAPPDLPPEIIDIKRIRGSESDRATFVETNSRSVANLMTVIRTLSDLLPKTLVLVIDQAEEILTQKSGLDGQSDRDLFFDFVAAFSNSSLHLKLVIALRTEYFGMFFNQLKKRRYSQEQLSDYFLNELSDAQLLEAIKMPTSTNIPVKYLQGRVQPADHYNFEFEEGLPERIVDELRTVETKGGILPVLQIICERLYRMVEPHRRNRGNQRWKIALADYESLGRLEQQVDEYVTDKLFEKIDIELPNLKSEERVRELALWKDLLYELVVVEADNRALTRLRRESDLETLARNLGCRTNFRKMITFLSDDAQRVLRPPEQLIDVRTKESSTYYSLGHDAIAVALSKWHETRSLQLDQFSWARKSVLYSLRGMSILFFLGSISLPLVLKVTGAASESEEQIAILAITVTYVIFGIVLWISGKYLGDYIQRMLGRFLVVRRLLSSILRF